MQCGAGKVSIELPLLWILAIDGICSRASWLKNLHAYWICRFLVQTIDFDPITRDCRYLEAVASHIEQGWNWSSDILIDIKLMQNPCHPELNSFKRACLPGL